MFHMENSIGKPPAHADGDDWSNIATPAERRRRQNRVNQRAYRMSALPLTPCQLPNLCIQGSANWLSTPGNLGPRAGDSWARLWIKILRRKMVNSLSQLAVCGLANIPADLLQRTHEDASLDSRWLPTGAMSLGTQLLTICSPLSS